MSRDPRKTARACFALASRAGTEGEKQAALNRGMAIVEKHGLSLDEFDVPGRQRGPIPPRPFMNSPANAAMREEILDAAFGAVWRHMEMSGFAFDVRPAKPETATQKAEREREERMSAYLRGRGA